MPLRREKDQPMHKQRLGGNATDALQPTHGLIARAQTWPTKERVTVVEVLQRHPTQVIRIHKNTALGPNL